MELLERYLLEIRRHLGSRDDEDDIVAEISDDLQSQLEAQQASFGRAADTDEEAAHHRPLKRCNRTDQYGARRSLQQTAPPATIATMSR